MIRNLSRIMFRKYKLPVIQHQNIKFRRQYNDCYTLKSTNEYSSKNVKNISSTALFGGVWAFFGEKEKEKEPELITILKRGILLIQKEEFDKAEQMLHLALKLAQEEMNSDGITYTYDVLANLAYDIGDYRKAQKLFIVVMQRLKDKGVELNDNKMLHISLKLSRIFESYGEKNKAEDGYRFCIENLEHRVNKENDHSDDTLLLWAMSLDFYAHFLLSVNRLREAFDCFSKAYETCLKVNGKEQEQGVILLNDLGTVSNMMGEFDKAVSYFEEAIEIGEKLPDMKDLGSVYVNLGRMYFVKNMIEESEKACTEGKRSALKYKDKETVEEANQCLNEVKNSLNA